MRSKILATVTLVLSLAGSVSFADTIRIGTEGGYPPYNFVNEKGEIDGMERELGDELCRRVKVECVWVKNDWDTIIPNLMSGNYDMISAAMSITDERSKVIDFSENYFLGELSIYVTLSGAKDDAIKGVVAAQAGTVQASYVASTDATLQEFSSSDEAIAAVKNGEADAIFSGKPYLNPIVKDSGGKLVFVGEDVTLDKGIGLGFRKSDAELRKKFTVAIQAMKADGSLNTLIEKWFGEDAKKF